MEQGKIRYAPSSDPARFGVDTVLIQNGRVIEHLSGSGRRDHQYKSLDYIDQQPFDFNISNAVVVSEDFHFVTQTRSEWTSAAALQVNGYCDIRIKGGFTIRSSAKFFDAKISGHLSDLVLLGDIIRESPPSQNAYNEFSVGFRKQAVNVIANVLEARDYLYLWIYAHHKVMYYANFLIPLVSREVLVNPNPDTFPSWKLTFEDIERLDDAYVWTAIHYYHITRKNADPEWHSLCQQLRGRKYRSSLYKSLAEFDLLFEAVPASKRLDIKQFLLKNFHQGRPRLDDSGAEVGYLSEDLVDQFKKKAIPALNNLVDIVYVDAGYKVKRLKVEETYIVTNEGIVASVDEIPLLAGRVSASTDTSYYFYLYYQTTTTNTAERKKEAAVLKDVIREYFTELFGDTIR